MINIIRMDLISILKHIINRILIIVFIIVLIIIVLIVLRVIHVKTDHFQYLIIHQINYNLYKDHNIGMEINMIISIRLIIIIKV